MSEHSDRSHDSKAPTGIGPDVREIGFVLDGRPMTALGAETVWLAARRHGVVIPHACLSLAPDFRPEGNCRLCVVEVEGRRTLQPSCLLKPAEGLVVHAVSERAVQARRIVLELLMAEADIDPASECGRVAAAMHIPSSRFPRSSARPAGDDSHPGIAVDLAKCIHCMRCVQACREVEVNNVIGMAGRGHAARIVFDFGDPMSRSTCVSCGSCAQACPTGALAFKAPSDG